METLPVLRAVSIVRGNIRGDAYWGDHERSRSAESSRDPRPGGLDAGEKVVAEGAGWRLVARRRPDDEPQTGLEWGWAMGECIVSGETWDGVWDAREEGRAVRLAPAIDRLELLELLAERAPDDDAVGFLGADALEEYLGSNPDVARVEQAALEPAGSQPSRLSAVGSEEDRR